MRATLPWWEQFPGRLEHEKSQLESLGVRVVEDAQAGAEGLIRWKLTVPAEVTDREEMNLVASFPDAYPFVRPEVQAPDLQMGHHQHPFGRNLCLIGRSSDAWNTSDTLEWLIREQLSTALTFGEATHGGEGEEDQGEPFSDYYTYQRNAVVLVDSDWHVAPHLTDGWAEVLISGPVPVIDNQLTVFVVAVLKNSHGEVLASLPDEILNLYVGAARALIRWNTLGGPVRADSAVAIWQAATDADAAVAHPTGSRTDIRLVGFPEEHSRTQTGLGWVLVTKQQGKPGRQRNSGNPAVRAAAQQSAMTHQLIRAGRAGNQDMRSRNPAMAPLAKKRVLIIGLGALGSRIAEHLARAGVGSFMLIDKDVLEPGNLERHACTMQHVGASKSEAVAHLLRQAAPYTEVVAWQLPVGRVETSVLADRIAASDLVIDATAEVGIARLTAHLAREHDTPWVMAAGTNGAWGGTVVRIDSGSTWCFSCFEWHRADDIASGGSSLAPIGDVAPPNQPVGCAEPTFTGTGFDLDEVGMQAVRSAVGVLLQRPTIDVATLAIHGFDEPDLPRWSPHQMQPHAECTH